MTILPFRHFTFFSSLLLAVSLLPISTATPARAANPAAKPPPDVIVFSNGDKLSGKLDHEAAGKVVFKSTFAGTVKISWDKIKELRTATPFAVIEKGLPVGRKKANFNVPVGTLTVEGGTLTVTTERGTRQIPVKNIAYMVSRPEFRKHVESPQRFLAGTTGTVTAGASTVNSTQNSVSVNTAIDLVRVAPGVAWIPPRQRTLLSFNSTYGRVTEANTPTVKTSILHGNLEEDEYFSPRVYLLQRATFDHNFSQGLDLQQLYGVGIGYTVVKNNTHELDITAIIDYINQQLAASETAAAVTRNIVGSSFGNDYTRKLPRKILLTESASYTPGWNLPENYSANVTAGVTVPVFKNFGFSAQAIDSYLNDPVHGFKGNSLQFNTGLTYAIRH